MSSNKAGHKEQDAAKAIAPATGKLGLMMPGMWAVATTFVGAACYSGSPLAIYVQHFELGLIKCQS
jgi:hypothetical protein